MADSLDRLDRTVEDLIAYMSIPPWGRIHDQLYPHYPLTPQYFDGAEPNLIGHDIHALTPEQAGGRWIFLDGHQADLDGRLSCTVLGSDGDGGDHRAGFFSVTRVRGLRVEEARGRARRPYREYVDLARVWFNGERRAEAFRFLFGSNGDCRWHMCQQGFGPFDAFDREYEFLIQGLIGMQFNRRYYWCVRLGYQGLPAIQVATDPVGAREVFRLRDLPEGRERRAALKHWVKAHLRQRREDDEAPPISVRQYLRGETDFTWNGLRCQIVPARFDLERDEEYRQLAAARRRAAKKRPKGRRAA